MNLAFEIVGFKGAIKFDQSRMDEFEIFERDLNSDVATNGFRRVEVGPYHALYGNFCPATGHHVCFNDMKIIEVGEFVKAILEDGKSFPDFEDGLGFEIVLQAVQDASDQRRWVDI